MVVISAEFNLLKFDKIVPGDDLSFKTITITEGTLLVAQPKIELVKVLLQYNSNETEFQYLL